MTVLLACFVVVAVLNPPRRVCEIDPRPDVQVAAAGAAIAAGAYLLVAAVSGPVLGALDISDANIRIAAGLVVAIRALVDVVLPPKPEPPGLRVGSGALAPLAFPILVRPEMAVLMLSVGHDIGVWRAGLVALTGVALAAGAMVVWSSGRSARLTGIAVSCVAVVAAVQVTLDGVLDV